ncbi:DNA protection during starvation protein 2, partial [human gut metagenome]
RPVSTLKGALEIATIKEATEQETTSEMVAAIFHDFELLINDLTHLMDVAEDEGDEGTFDLVLGLKTQLEKNVWM